MKRTTLPQRASATGTISYAGYCFPPDLISYAVWLYYRFPLSLRMAEELLAARGIELTYETARRWSVKFGLGIAQRIRSTSQARGNKRHLDGAVVTINGRKHWLWSAVDQHGRAPRVLITGKLKAIGCAWSGIVWKRRTQRRIAVCASERPRSAIISTRSCKLSL